MTSYPELVTSGDRVRVSPWLATKTQTLIKGGGCHKRLPQNKKQCELFPQSSWGKWKGNMIVISSFTGQLALTGKAD